MSQTKIDVEAVMQASSQLKKAKNLMTEVRSEVNQIQYQTDSRILGRNNLWNRFQKVAARLSALEARTDRIRTVAENGASSFRSADLKVKAMKDTLEERQASLHPKTGRSSFSAASLWHESPAEIPAGKAATDNKEKGRLNERL